MRTLLSSLSALLLFGAAQARADYLYHWSITPNSGVITSAGNTGSVTVTVAPDPVTPVSGDTSFLAATIGVTHSPNPTSATDSYNLTYQLQMTVTDTSTNKTSNPITFDASLNGTVTASTSNLTNTFVDPSQYVTVSGQKYTVTLTPTLIASVPLLSNAPAAEINASVTVGTATVASTPEPSTLVLAGVASSLFGFTRLWRARRPAPLTHTPV
jgi:hypothetical protein